MKPFLFLAAVAVTLAVLIVVRQQPAPNPINNSPLDQKYGFQDLKLGAPCPSDTKDFKPTDAHDGWLFTGEPRKFGDVVVTGLAVYPAAGVVTRIQIAFSGTDAPVAKQAFLTAYGPASTESPAITIWEGQRVQLIMTMVSDQCWIATFREKVLEKEAQEAQIESAKKGAERAAKEL